LEFADQGVDIEARVDRETRLQIPNGFSELTASADQVCASEVMKTDGGLDQSLIAGLVGGFGSDAPEVFPNLVRVIKPSGIK